MGNDMMNPVPGAAQSGAPKPEYRLLVVITTLKQAEKATRLFAKGQVPLQYQFMAHGTAPNAMMEMLGLGSRDKTVLISMMPKKYADAMLRRLSVDLGLIATNSGIAFTVPISGGSSVLIKMIESLGAQGGRGSMERDVIDMSVQNCSLIMAIVNQGYSEEVMNAARPAGARGGTVFPARRLVNEETMKFWGISIQPEKEIVLIVAQAPYKKAIMQAIGDACGFHSDAHGLVISLPVEDAIGLKAPEDDGASDAIDMK